MYATNNPALKVQNPYNYNNLQAVSSPQNPVNVHVTAAQNQQNMQNVVYPPNALPAVNGYNKTQHGSLWIVLLVVGFISLCSGIFARDGGSSLRGLLCIIWSIGIMWNNVQDKGDHLLITYGPCRWVLCGMGREKIKYSNIKDYAISRSCTYGFGIPCCSGLKLFSTCSCCCGQKVIRLSVNERLQGLNANDPSDCCIESCCLKQCCGQRAEYIGSGCCFKYCFNPCGGNCCMFNTIHISTEDADGLLNLLNHKCTLIPQRGEIVNGNQNIQYANL